MSKVAHTSFLNDVDPADRQEEDAIAALQESERRLLTAQAVAQIGSWEFDVATGIISWSPETFRLLQFDPAKGEPDFETLQARYHPDDRAAHAAAVQRAVQHAIPYEFNLRAVMDDGSVRWLQVSGKPGQADDGTVTQLFGVIQDITERKGTRDALVASERRYRQIVETAHEGIWVTDTDGWIVFANSKIGRMVGYTPEEVIGKSIHFFASEESLPLVKAGLERRRRGLSDQYEIQLRHRVTGDFWVTVSASPILTPAGDFEGTLGMLTDISAQKWQEALLRESEARFRSTFDDAAIGMSINSLDGVRLQVNNAFCRFLGAAREEIVGTGNSERADPASLAENLALRERCLNGEIRFYRMEKCYRHQDGRLVWGDLTASLVRDSATGKPLYFISQIADITARKRLEQQMVQREKLAAIGQLVTGVAHEINNPLAVISGHAQLLALHPDPQIREDAATIRGMVERASRIVRSLRSYAQPGEVSPDSRSHFTDLNSVVESALSVIQYRLHDLLVTLETDLAGDLAPVPMNAGEIEQVVVNLLSNAADALQDTPRDRRVIRIRTWDTGPEDTDDRTKAAGLSVSDDGPGMAPEVAARVFDPFFTTKDTDSGTGLGLYISHSILQAHGGTIRAESREGVGTTFTVCLPYEFVSDPG